MIPKRTVDITLKMIVIDTLTMFFPLTRRTKKNCFEHDGIPTVSPNGKFAVSRKGFLIIQERPKMRIP